MSAKTPIFEKDFRSNPMHAKNKKLMAGYNSKLRLFNVLHFLD